MVENKTVVITGGAGGIGTALGEQFGKKGGKIAIIDINFENLSEAVKKLTQAGITALPVQCDITNFDNCKRAMETIEKRFGGINLLINNAGITHRSTFLKTDVSVYRKVMDVNYFGAINCTKAAMPMLIEQHGKIVAISSVAGFSPLLGRSGYCASKYALHGFFDTLRAELRPSGVSIMLVCPGFTKTHIEQNALDGQGAKAQHPRSTVGKIATPEKVAQAIYKGVISNKKQLILSTTGKLAWVFHNFFPGIFENVMISRFNSELN